jgi:hypothetical protein
MILHGAALKVPGVTPRGIIDLELAATVDHATEIYNAWHPHLTKRAINNTGIDFLFIVSYSMFLYSSARLTSRLSTLKKSGLFISKLMVVAAIFDVLENVLMFSTLSAHFKKEIVAATYIFASLKFAFIGIGLLYIVITFVTSIFLRSKKQTTVTDGSNY